ncbi:MAG: hypothetical protein OEV42_14060 [Deltaproteobacteria bacterium]|nr:hypothetical protein [Deltaproteobacteria bacterium]
MKRKFFLLTLTLFLVLTSSASLLACCADYMVIVPHTVPGINPNNNGPVLRYRFGGTGPFTQLSSIPSSYFNDPFYATFNSVGEVFIANRHGIVNGQGSIDRFKFDSEGNFTHIEEITGNNLNVVSGVAFSPDGKLYASGYKNGKISRFKFTNATSLAEADGSFNTGEYVNQDIAFSASGEMFTTHDSSRVNRWLIDPETGQVSSNGYFYVSGALRLHGLTFNRKGELFIADGGAYKRVHRILFNENNNPVYNGYISIDGSPRGVALSKCDELFVTSLDGQSGSGISRFIFDKNDNPVLREFITYSRAVGDISLFPLFPW